MHSQTVAASAPAKVILFGEHAVVYEQPAISAAINLRSTVRIRNVAQVDNPSLQEPDASFRKVLKFEVGINQPDSAFPKNTEGFSVYSKISRKDWTDIKYCHFPVSFPNVRDYFYWKANTRPLVLFLSALFFEASLITFVSESESFEHFKLSIVAVMFFSIILLEDDKIPFLLETFTQIPIGAGLGSSGSFSVSLAAAFLEYSGREYSDADIFQWSDICETIIHGTSSGLDPLTILRGGLLFFQKEKQAVKTISLPFITERCSIAILFSAIPRKTSELVLKVGSFKNTLEAAFRNVITSIGALTQQAYQICLNVSKSGTFFPELSKLVVENHKLLSMANPFGLSIDTEEFYHLRLKIEDAGIRPDPVEFASKITGAGGGGCAFYLFATASDRERFISQVHGNILDKTWSLFPVEFTLEGLVLSKS